MKYHNQTESDRITSLTMNVSLKKMAFKVTYSTTASQVTGTT